MQENISEIANKLYEMEKEHNKMSSKGVKSYSVYCEETRFQRRLLNLKMNELVDDDVIFDEAQFKCFWQSGLLGKWKICKTKDRYISTIKKYVDLYGTPLERDTIMYKAVNEDEELFGSSWTKSWKSACNFAAKTGIKIVKSMVVPKGAKSIHVAPTFRFKESEDLIDTTSVINETLDKFAELKCYNLDYKTQIMTGVFEFESSGCRYLHKLDLADSMLALSKQLKNAA